MRSITFFRYRLYRVWIPLRKIITAIVPGSGGTRYIYRSGKRRPYFRQDHRIIVDPGRPRHRTKSGSPTQSQSLLAGKKKKKKA